MNMNVPDFCASSADMGSPVNTISMARDFPTARGSRCVPPAPKKKEKKTFNSWIMSTYCDACDLNFHLEGNTEPSHDNNIAATDEVKNKFRSFLEMKCYCIISAVTVGTIF